MVEEHRLPARTGLPQRADHRRPRAPHPAASPITSFRALGGLCPGWLLASGGLFLRPFFRGRHNRLLGDLGQLEIGLLLLLSVAVEQIDHFLLTQGFGQRDIGAVSSDLIMLDPLYAGDNDRCRIGPLLSCSPIEC